MATFSNIHEDAIIKIQNMGKYIRQTTQFSPIKTHGKKEVGSRGLKKRIERSSCEANVTKS